MSDCAGFDEVIQLIIDDELVGEDLNRAHQHLQTCDTCRLKLEEERSLSKIVRQSRLLQFAPPSLRDRVLQITAEASSINDNYRPVRGQDSVRRHIFPNLLMQKSLVLIAAGLFLALGGLFLIHLRTQSRSTSFIDAAILADRGLVTRITPLDVQSNSPKEVSAWFADRVPFRFRLPNASIASDATAKYTLEGGRLILFQGEHAALIAFRLGNDNISLLIASDRLAHATGGVTSEFDGLMFHSMQRASHNVVTWNNQNLTYALVFPAQIAGGRSCLSCHNNSSIKGQSTTDKAYLLQPF